MVVAGFAEQAVVDDSMDVELIEKGIAILESINNRIKESAVPWTYLGNRCSENNNFVKLSNSFHESVDAGSLNHVHIMVLAFNLYRYSEVGLM